MTTGLWAAAACAIAAGAAARAQEADVRLPTLTVEADSNRGFFGDILDDSAGSVMKADIPIVDTPRSVSVVTQQQIEDRGARSLT
jgi:iron complex outermembrane recepter protein